MKTLQKERDCLAYLAADYEWNEVKKVLPVDEYGVKIQVRNPTGKTKWMSFNKFGPIQLEEYLNQDAAVKLKSTKDETKWLNVDENTISAVQSLDDHLRKSKSSTKEKLYNVFSLRDGKKVKWNSIPLSKGAAEVLAEQLKKANIPSVDIDSIDIIKVGVNIAEVDRKKFFDLFQETKLLMNNSFSLYKFIENNMDNRMLDKEDQKKVEHKIKLIETALGRIKNLMK